MDGISSSLRGLWTTPCLAIGLNFNLCYIATNQLRLLSAIKDVDRGNIARQVLLSHYKSRIDSGLLSFTGAFKFGLLETGLEKRVAVERLDGAVHQKRGNNAELLPVTDLL